MAAPKVYDLKECTLYLVDGDSPANELAFTFDEGTLSYSRKRNIEYKLDRGVIDDTRLGDDVPLEVSISGRFNAVISSSGDPLTITEFLEQENAGSALVSVGGACEPFAIDLVLHVDHDCSGVEDEIVTFPQFRFEDIGGDFRAGTLTISGKCNAVKPTAIRTTLA